MRGHVGGGDGGLARDRNGVLAISAAILADFLAGMSTVMKSWSRPETETVLLLHRGGDQHGHRAADDHHWTFDVAAFPIFIVCMGSVEVSSSASSQAHGCAGPG